MKQRRNKTRAIFFLRFFNVFLTRNDGRRNACNRRETTKKRITGATAARFETDITRVTQDIIARNICVFVSRGALNSTHHTHASPIGYRPLPYRRPRAIAVFSSRISERVRDGVIVSTEAGSRRPRFSCYSIRVDVHNVVTLCRAFSLCPTSRRVS